MPALFVAVLLVGVPTALLLAHRLGWLERTRTRRGFFLALAVALVASMPWQGVGYLHVKRLNLLLVLVAVLLLLLRALGVRWLRDRGRRVEVWALLALVSVLAYVDFFDFHGERTWVHLHDAAHYYLGSKYYAELGHADLYTAMLRAEAELYDNRFKAIEARDLATYDLVHIRRLLQRSEPVKAAFTPERWADFQRDVDLFRQRLGPHYGRVLTDHGFNPTPVWALLGGVLANRVPAGSSRGLLVLCLLDVALLVALFAIVGRVFGVETMLVSLVFFCVVFGATFGWVGGAFLRYPWLLAVVAGTACVQRRHHAAAGALFALAAALRVFPALLVVPLAAKALHLAWRRRGRGWRVALPRRHARFFAAFAVTAVVLLGLTALLPRSLEHWRDFRANMDRHVANISPNVVGSTELLALRPGAPRQVTAEEFRALKQRRSAIHRAQLWLVFLPVLAAVAWVARRRSDLGALALGLPLLYTGLSLAAYYWTVLLVLLLARRHDPRHLALLFAAEAVPYTAMLFVERDATLFVLRGLALAVVLFSWR